MDSIARAGAIAQGGILAGRAIKEAEGDSIGKIRRSDDLQRENDQGAMENVAIKAGSKVASGHVIKIPVAEFDRFAGLDFAAYDDAPVQQRLDDPNVEKPYQNIKQHLGEGFGFKNGVTVETSFTLTVN